MRGDPVDEISYATEDPDPTGNIYPRVCWVARNTMYMRYPGGDTSCIGGECCRLG